MSKIIKNNTALVLSSAQDTEQSESLSSRFMELVKICGIKADIANAIPDLERVKNYDCILVDLKYASSQQELTEQVMQLSAYADIVFFNAGEQGVCESSALFAGVKGIFYRSDKPNLILKGLETVMSGEPWFKRSTLNQAVIDLLKMKQANRKKTVQKINLEADLPQLTKREQTIVKLVSSGAQNKEIAEQLHISPNTVKTHIYSLFRKTSSRNRVELITWLQQCLPTSLVNS